jgi:hypothetical protein
VGVGDPRHLSKSFILIKGNIRPKDLKIFQYVETAEEAREIVSTANGLE